LKDYGLEKIGLVFASDPEHILGILLYLYIG